MAVSCVLKAVGSSGVTYVLNLVFVKVGHAVNNHPRKRATEVDDFVHEEGHDSSGQDIVANEGVPGRPETLKVVELNIVFRNLLKLTPVSALLVRERKVEKGGRVAVKMEVSGSDALLAFGQRTQRTCSP